MAAIHVSVLRGNIYWRYHLTFFFPLGYILCIVYKQHNRQSNIKIILWPVLQKHQSDGKSPMQLAFKWPKNHHAEEQITTLNNQNKSMLLKFSLKSKCVICSPVQGIFLRYDCQRESAYSSVVNWQQKKSLIKYIHILKFIATVEFVDSSLNYTSK